MSRSYFFFRVLSMVILMSSEDALSHGFSEPQEAVETYIKAVSTGSGEHIEMAFFESASIQYYDRGGEFKNYSRAEFQKLVGTGNTWDAKIEITSMRVTGNAASATVEFTWGENGQHGYVDYLNLIYSKDSWHISDKVAQYIAR